MYDLYLFEPLQDIKPIMPEKTKTNKWIIRKIYYKHYTKVLLLFAQFIEQISVDSALNTVSASVALI